MTTDTMLNESTVRAMATRQGCLLRKSRQRIHLDNQGGYQLIDRDRNWVVAGTRYELSLADVAEFLRGDSD